MKIFIVLSAALALSMARPSGFLTPHLAAITAYTGAGPSGSIVSSVYPGYIAATGPTVFSAGAPGVVATHGPAVVSARFATTPVAVGVPGPLTSLYQAQDILGQYSYGYASPLSSKTEVKTLDGVTRGGYAYLDAQGKVQSVSYTSDAVNGFQVAATNLPVAPVPVAAPALVQVSDTAEVAAAKAAHIAALAEANAKATSGDDTESVDAAKTGDSGAADGSASEDSSASADGSVSASEAAKTSAVEAKAAETPADAVKLNEIQTGAVLAPVAHLGISGAPGALLAATPYGYTTLTGAHHGIVAAAPGVAFPHALGYGHLLGGPIISAIPAVGNVEVKASSSDAAAVKAAVTTAEVQGVGLTAAGVPVDTPEVAQAKAAHLAAVEAEKLKHVGW